MALSASTAQPVHPSPAKSLRRVGIVAFASVALVFAPSSLAQTQQGFGCIGYCGSGIAIGIGVVAAGVAGVGILLAVNHSHHNLKGCVLDSPSGLQLRTSDSQSWSLDGDPSRIKPGDLVKLHGSRVKKAKNGKLDHAFRVDKLKKDYGPCRETAAAATAAAP